jgi:ribosome-associated protein
MKHAPFELNEDEMVFSAIRAQGAGGQNVNKVSNAVHLRFDVGASSLPQDLKARLLAVSDQRISAEGVVVIKAQGSRSLEKNRKDAIARLHALITTVAQPAKTRRPTKPTYTSRLRRLDVKSTRGRVKRLRGRVQGGD